MGFNLVSESDVQRNVLVHLSHQTKELGELIAVVEFSLESLVLSEDLGDFAHDV